MAESKGSRSRLERLQRREKYLSLRLQGLTYDEIGRRMGTTRSTAHKIVTREIDRLNASLKEKAIQLRKMELDRLDALQAAVWPRAIGGSDLKAVETVLKIMERRARLKGLDAATKTKADLNVLAKKSDEELLAEARRHGLKVPDVLEDDRGNDAKRLGLSEIQGKLE